MAARKKLARIALYLVLTAMVLIILFPYYWMIVCSVRPETEIYSSRPTLIPGSLSLDNYRKVMGSKIPQYLLNSFLISGGAMLMCLAVSIPAAYALARFRFKGKNAVTSGVLLFKLLPQSATLIPLYIMLVNTKLFDTRFGLSFVNLFIMVPYTIWVARGFIKTVPFSVEEAAMIDGCNRIQAIVRVIVPIISAGLFSVALYAFMLSWEEFLFSSTFTVKNAKTVTVGLASLIGEDASDWGAILAGSVMMGAPIIILFCCLQNSFIKGMVGGAVKG